MMNASVASLAQQGCQEYLEPANDPEKHGKANKERHDWNRRNKMQDICRHKKIPHTKCFVGSIMKGEHIYVHLLFRTEYSFDCLKQMKS